MDKPVRIAILPGDGVGGEVMAEATTLPGLGENQGPNIQTLDLPYGAGHYLATGETLPEAAFADLRDGCDAILFGAVGDPRIPDGRHAEEILLRLRQGLELTVNFRPCHPHCLVRPRISILRCSAKTRKAPIAFRARRNLEGPSISPSTRNPPSGVCCWPPSSAPRSGRRPLTLAHKANVLKHGHGLWMRVFEELRQDHPEVAAQGMHADALLCALVRNPTAFGVIAADNYLGDLISDLCAAYIGGMGVAPSFSWAPHRPFRCSALAEPVHGSAPDIAGKGLANPIGMILSTALLFRHLGWEQEAGALEGAVAGALNEGAKTLDLGGSLATAAMGTAIRDRLPS